jgi:hypothetical protein
VVILGPGIGGIGLDLFVGDLNAGRLMRRRGPCPAARPANFDHALYVDSKTMMESVGGQSSFTYLVNGEELPEVAAEPDLSLVDGVGLWVVDGSERGRVPEGLWGSARVGR